MDPGGQGPDRGLKRRGRHRESLEDGQCSRGSGGWVGAPCTGMGKVWGVNAASA